jgi:putative tricarboxylic transport membrane protein
VNQFNKEEHRMRRVTFLKALAAGAVMGTLPLRGGAAPALKLMIPANPGGGWDTTGRALGAALVEAKAADAVQYENKGGNAGALGLAQFLQTAKGDPEALLMTGSVMLGGLVSSKSPLTLTQCTPIARLTSEYNVFVVPPDSPLKSMADLVALLKRDPAGVKWGGGSRGSTEHIAACALARAVRVDPKQVNYVASKGGADAAAALLNGQVTVAGSGYSEFSEQIAAGKMRALGVTAQKRLPGVAIPTLKEQGYDVTLGNWRGVYGGPGLSEAQRAALTEMVVRATRTKAWQDALQKNKWTPALETGKAFTEFVDYELSSTQAIMYLAGML